MRTDRRSQFPIVNRKFIMIFHAGGTGGIMPYEFKLSKYSMLLTTHAGEVKTRTFREVIPYEDYRCSLLDFVFTHIGQTFVWDDFSPCTITWNYDGRVFRKHFDTLDELKAWYITLT